MTKPSTDYIARQKALHAKREEEGYHTPEEVARRAGQLQGGREYNARIAGIVGRAAEATGTDERDVAAFLPVFVETAVRMIQAEEISLDDLQTPHGWSSVARVASNRIRDLLDANAEEIMGRVWDAANASD